MVNRLESMLYHQQADSGCQEKWVKSVKSVWWSIMLCLPLAQEGESNGTNAFIYLPSWACPTPYFTQWGPGKTRDLPRLIAQVHSWAELNSFAAPCCLLGIKTECYQRHDYVISDHPQQAWRPTSSARTHTASQSLHLIQLIIMTTFECPRIT